MDTMVLNMALGVCVRDLMYMYSTKVMKLFSTGPENSRTQSDGFE